MAFCFIEWLKVLLSHLQMKECAVMSKFLIEGGKRLSGSIDIQGSKNSALPILSACVLTEKPVIIHNCPDLSDIGAAIKILEALGCTVKREFDTVVVDASLADTYSIPDDLMREMRSSIVFLGALVGRFKKAEFSAPGGCEIGLRPIDLHIKALEALGATVENDEGRIKCSIENELRGGQIVFGFPSVGATENAILAAVTARGETVLENCAREPEISDLADFLNACGARIKGAGEGTITIEGVKSLGGAEYTVIPDRIVSATYMAAVAATGGNAVLRGVIPAHLRPVVPVFLESGCGINVKGHELRITAPPELSRVNSVVTMPYPGFPTDAQAPIMAMMTVARGTSVFTENIFECRYKHVSELLRFGAKITVEGRMAVVEGMPALYGATATAGDLRGGAALMVAALVAKGHSEITDIYHIDRGYENPLKVFRELGADIKRE